MGLFSKKDGGAWQASTSKAPWWSAAAGTHVGYVNGEAVAAGKTRREARRAARREAGRLSGED